MDRIRKIKIRKADGSMTDYIPIGVEAQYVDLENGDSLQENLDKKIYVYNNVEDMKRDKKLKIGDYVQTSGYYELNDGGAGLYKVIISSSLYHENLENGLKAELVNLNNSFNIKQFGAYGDSLNDDTKAIQKALDAITDGQTLIFPKGEYKVSKNLDLKYKYNDEPCLLLDNKQNITLLGRGGKLKVYEHAQGILEVTQCKNLTINGLVFEGCKFLPPIFPNGRGEKGGYDFTGYSTAAGRKNNCVNTIGMPYADGTGKVTSMFYGGYIGNNGTGLIVYRNSSQVNIINCEASYFNNGGISIGTHWDANHEHYDYCQDIIIDSCRIHHTYDNGINLVQANNIKVVNCTITEIGHPDAQKTMENLNPGYGITSRLTGKNFATNILVSNNNITHCRRKGFDAHSGENITIANNIIDDCWYSGIELGHVANSPIIKNILIEGNQVYNSGILGAGIHTLFTIDETTQTPINNNVSINNNLLINCAGYNNGAIVVSRTIGASVSNNKIIGTMNGSYGTAQGIRTTYSDYLDIHDNTIDFSKISNEINWFIVATNGAEDINCVNHLNIYNNLFKLDKAPTHNVIYITCDEANVINNICYAEGENSSTYIEKRPYRCLNTKGLVYGNETVGKPVWNVNNISPYAKQILESDNITSNGTITFKYNRGINVFKATLTGTLESQE